MCAPARAFTASANAVSNPKLLSKNSMSLSMVFGMPTTLLGNPRRVISRVVSEAPRNVPSPPMTNSASTRISSSVSTISAGLCGPRDVPSIVPPTAWMEVTWSGRSVRGMCPRRGISTS